MGGGSPQPFGRGREEIGNETSSLQDGASPAKPLQPLPPPGARPGTRRGRVCSSKCIARAGDIRDLKDGERKREVCFCLANREFASLSKEEKILFVLMLKPL